MNFLFHGAMKKKKKKKNRKNSANQSSAICMKTTDITYFENGLRIRTHEYQERG